MSVYWLLCGYNLRGMRLIWISYVLLQLQWFLIPKINYFLLVLLIAQSIDAHHRHVHFIFIRFLFLIRICSFFKPFFINKTPFTRFILAFYIWKQLLRKFIFSLLLILFLITFIAIFSCTASCSHFLLGCFICCLGGSANVCVGVLK